MVLHRRLSVTKYVTNLEMLFEMKVNDFFFFVAFLTPILHHHFDD